jgi:PAS domain S-box-containing protein
MLSSEIAPDILDSAPDAIVVVDGEGTIVFANRQVSALFGYTQAAVIGTAIDQLLPERFRATHSAHRQRYAQHARVRPMGIGLDLSARRHDGTEFPVEISLSPISYKGEMLVAAAIRDATERREAQAQLRRAREAADLANQTKTRFLATASHDLRQPLQTLSLLNGAMRRSTAAPSLIEALLQQEQAIDAMARLLNALLDISKLESGAIQPQLSDFPVATILAQMRAEFGQLAAQKGLELRIESCEHCVHSDPSLVSQVLRNLIANAIKYTSAGWVCLRGSHAGANVRLEVQDSGIGIPAAALTHIFDEFYQVGVSNNTAREGYGLGLSIVRRIVELLGVALEVKSESGKGSVFSISLPAADAQAAAADGIPAAAQAHTARAHRKILLVEDDPAVRKATQMLLKVAGYVVVTAASRSEALGALTEHADLGLLIADYHLTEGETGLQVIEAVRARLGRPIRAVLISGDTSSVVKDVAQDSQMRIASKPINADELLALLEQLDAA